MNNQLSVKKYPLYKDSGVEWLGDVPEHWELKRLKDLSKLVIDGTHFTPDYTNDGIHFLSVNDITRKPFDLNKSKFISPNAHKELIRRCYPKKGDILLSKNGTIGVPFLVDFDEEISIYVSLCLIKILPKVNTKYSYYSFLASFMFEQYNLHSKTNSVTNLHLDKLRNFLQLCPPLSEQKAIADYLDTQTAQIDRKIDLLTQKAKLYQEFKQSLINETVTRGLDKFVPMKDSGIEWLGNVPEHWEIQRLKNLSQIKTGGRDTINSIEDGKYPFFVRSQTIERINSYSFDGEAILTAGDGVGVGKVFHYVNEKFDYHQRVYKISHFRGLDGKFLFYYMRNHFYKEAFRLNAKATVDSLRMPMFQNFPVVFGCKEEQKAIADYLDTKTAQIDQIIQTINAQIEKLKELRKTLINDVVTGKIKVIE